MAPRQAQAPGQPIPGPILFVAVLGAGAAIYFGFPGLVLIWLGLIACAWQNPPFVPTGPKDKSGYAQPAHEGERAKMLGARKWRELKTALLFPGKSWMPGKSVSLSWIVAVWAGAAAYFVPVTDVEYTMGYGQWMNAVAVFASIASYTWVSRRHQVEDDENPGARIKDLVVMAQEQPRTVIAAAVGGLIGSILVGTVASVMLPLVAPVPEPAIWALAFTGVPLLCVGPAWTTSALAHWREVVAERTQWKPRWESQKHITVPPRLTDIRTVGPARILSFQTDYSCDVNALFGIMPAILPMLGSMERAAMVDVPERDSQGQDVPGSSDTLRFEIIIWPKEELPDWSDPDTDPKVMHEFARSCFSWLCEGQPGRSEVRDLEKITTEGPAVWELTWHDRGTGNATGMRQAKGMVEGAFNTQVAIDHRSYGGAGSIYLGAISEGSFDPASGTTSQQVSDILEEDDWTYKWEQTMKMGTNAPVPQFGHRISAKLSNGSEMNALPFMTRLSQTIHQYFEYEKKMITTMNGSTMMTITGYVDPDGRGGSRHPGAFTLVWTSGQVPAKPQDLIPSEDGRNVAEKMYLQARVNSAFGAARLAERPEVIRVRALTKVKTEPDAGRPGRPTRGGRPMRPSPRGRRSQHIWSVDLRLYGGVTLSDIRGAVVRMKDHMGATWFRVAESNDGCTLVFGADPASVEFGLEEDRHLCLRLDWQQAWLDSKISGNNGLLPRLTEINTMPDNELVTVLKFELPPGLDFGTLKAATPKLSTNTGNAFVQVKKFKGDARAIQLLCAVQNPIPAVAHYDWEKVKATIAERPTSVPFAVGIDGSVLDYDPVRDIHLLIVGGSGSGKSVIMQSLITGALAGGAEVYIGDPTKGAADFLYMKDYAKAFTTNLSDTSAMMRGLYEEVQRRVALLGQYGVAKIQELPDEVRPPLIYLILDEFTGLIGKEKVPARSDDPDQEMERDEIQFVNLLKGDVGSNTGKIAREARSAGVTLILATQKLVQADLDEMPGGKTLKVNLSRLIAGRSTMGDRMSALKAPMEAPPMGDEIPPGRAIYESNASPEPELIQCFWEPGNQEQLAEYVAEVRTPYTQAEKLDLEAHRRPDPNATRDQMMAPAFGAPVVQEIDLGVVDLDLGGGWDDDDDLVIGELETADASDPVESVDDEDEDEAELDWDDDDEPTPVQTVLGQAPDFVAGPLFPPPTASAASLAPLDEDAVPDLVAGPLFAPTPAETPSPVDHDAVPDFVAGPLFAPPGAELPAEPAWDDGAPKMEPAPPTVSAPVSDFDFDLSEPVAPAPITAPTPVAASTGMTLLVIGDTGPMTPHVDTIQQMGLTTVRAAGAGPDAGPEWEQLTGVNSWLDTNPGYTQVIWIDTAFRDSLDADDLARESFATRGLGFLPLATTRGGITSAMASKAVSFANPTN